jgi:DNA polymerase-3 subunit gamma/tau
MGGEVKTASEIAEEAAVAAAAEVIVDPRSQEKLMEAKGKLLSILSSGRVRYVPVFETMRAEGNIVHLTVASRELFEEIMRDKLRWLGEIAQVAGINGVLELEIVVNEAIKIARPITIEDRLKHLMTKNDRLKEMIEQLVLDAE